VLGTASGATSKCLVIHTKCGALVMSDAGSGSVTELLSCYIHACVCVCVCVCACVCVCVCVCLGISKSEPPPLPSPMIMRCSVRRLKLLEVCLLPRPARHPAGQSRLASRQHRPHPAQPRSPPGAMASGPPLLLSSSRYVHVCRRRPTGRHAGGRAVGGQQQALAAAARRTR
jgi:hypothetical protein